MVQIPNDLSVYHTSPRFTSETVPHKLLTDHELKPGVFGRVVVVEGEVEYWVGGDPPQMTPILPGDREVRVLPEQRHWIKPHERAVFYIEFLRVEET